MSEYYEGPSYGLRDRQQDPPAHICPECQGELFPGDSVYHMDGGDVCGECFEDWVRDLLATSPALLAHRLGIEAEPLTKEGLPC